MWRSNSAEKDYDILYVCDRGSVGKKAVWSTRQIIMCYAERAVQVSHMYVCMYVCMYNVNIILE